MLYVHFQHLHSSPAIALEYNGAYFLITYDLETVLYVYTETV